MSYDPQTLSRFDSVGVDAPLTVSDVPAAIENLKEKLVSSILWVTGQAQNRYSFRNTTKTILECLRTRPRRIIGSMLSVFRCTPIV